MVLLFASLIAFLVLLNKKLLNVTTDVTDPIVSIVAQKQKNSMLMKGIVFLLCRQ